MSGDPLTMVLSRLEEVRRAGSGYMACCPAHVDHKPSLKVDLAADGKVLLKCFADCSTEEILRALGLTISDLFPRPSQGNVPPGEIVAKYEYRDKDGALLYQVLRKNPKGFVQRRPDGEGGWLWDMK